jgi:oligosaccharyltransferase complex subunit gamma
MIILPFLANSALAASTDRFGESISRPFPLKLDDAKFATLTNAPRDYASVILLTAMDPKFGCNSCHDFQSEWELISRSWQKGDRKGESRTIFAEVDFMNGRNTFQSLGLQHAPVIFLYPPTEGINAKASAAPLRFDFQG